MSGEFPFPAELSFAGGWTTGARKHRPAFGVIRRGRAYDTVTCDKSQGEDFLLVVRLLLGSN